MNKSKLIWHLQMALEEYKKFADPNYKEVHDESHDRECVKALYSLGSELGINLKSASPHSIKNDILNHIHHINKQLEELKGINNKPWLVAELKGAKQKIKEQNKTIVKLHQELKKFDSDFEVV